MRSGRAAPKDPSMSVSMSRRDKASASSAASSSSRVYELHSRDTHAFSGIIDGTYAMECGGITIFGC